MITFNKSDFDTILEYAKKNLPEEACGPVSYTHLTLPTNREV